MFGQGPFELSTASCRFFGTPDAFRDRSRTPLRSLRLRRISLPIGGWSRMRPPARYSYRRPSGQIPDMKQRCLKSIVAYYLNPLSFSTNAVDVSA